MTNIYQVKSWIGTTFLTQWIYIVVQLLSRVWFFATPWTAAHQASLSVTLSQSLFRCMSIESMMSSSRPILCCPLLLLPSIFPSIKVFSSESVLHIRWPKDWSVSFSLSPFSEYSGLISYRIDWFDLLAVQGTLNSLLQHHSLKASVLLCSTFFMVQLSHPYIPTGKTIALTRWTFARGQCEELCPWQRSWGRRLGIHKGVIKPQETPCSWASTPKPEPVLCSHLHLGPYGGLSPITFSLGEGVNVQLQGNKNSWAWQECFSLRTPLKVI